VISKDLNLTKVMFDIGKSLDLDGLRCGRLRSNTLSKASADAGVKPIGRL